MFLKYMNVSVVIAFLSFLILGIVLTMTISTYWYNEKHATLTTRTDNIAEYILRNIRGNVPLTEESSIPFEWDDQSSAAYVDEFMRVYAGDMDSDIIVVDHNARVVLSVSDNPRLHRGTALFSDTVRRVLSQNNYFEKGTLGGLYEENRYISAKRLTIHNGLTVAGAVIVTTDT